MTENEQIRRDKMTPMNPKQEKDEDPETPVMEPLPTGAVKNEEALIDRILRLGTPAPKAEKNDRKAKPHEKDISKEKNKEKKKEKKRKGDDGKDEAGQGVGT